MTFRTSATLHSVIIQAFITSTTLHNVITQNDFHNQCNTAQCHNAGVHNQYNTAQCHKPEWLSEPVQHCTVSEARMTFRTSATLHSVISQNDVQNQCNTAQCRKPESIMLSPSSVTEVTCKKVGFINSSRELLTHCKSCTALQ